MASSSTIPPASAPSAPPTAQVSPQLTVWQYALSGDEIIQVDASVRTLLGRTIVGRMVGQSPSRSSVRDWLQTALRLPEGRVAEIELLGRGVFRAVLSDERSAQALLERSFIISDSRIIHLRQWYPEFTAQDFDTRFDIPRFPVTISFPGIPFQFRHLIPSVAAKIGIVIPGSLVSGVGSPRIQVWTPSATVFPDVIEFLWRDSSFRQRISVSGRPDQCLRCQEFGHLARDCPRPPRQSRQHPQRRPQQQQHPRSAAQVQAQPQQPRQPVPQGQSSRHVDVPGSSGDKGVWQTVDRRHRFRPQQGRDPQSSAVQHPQQPPLPPPLPPISEEDSQVDPCLSLVPASQLDVQVVAPLPVVPSGPAAMDTELVPPPSSQLLVLAPPVPPSPPPSVGRPVSRSFMDCAPGSWRFDIADSSADELGPVEVRIYMLRQRTRSLLGNALSPSPVLSFFLPFTGEEAWTEESVLSFTCSQILLRLADWVPSVPLDLSHAQLAQCLGKVKWENSLGRFCLPVVLFFADSWARPRELREWKSKPLSKALKCSAEYISAWFDASASFGPGGNVPLLPPDLYSLDGLVPEAKRQRN